MSLIMERHTMGQMVNFGLDQSGKDAADALLGSLNAALTRSPSSQITAEDAEMYIYTQIGVRWGNPIISNVVTDANGSIQMRGGEGVHFYLKGIDPLKAASTGQPKIGFHLVASSGQYTYWSGAGVTGMGWTGHPTSLNTASVKMNLYYQKGKLTNEPAGFSWLPLSNGANEQFNFDAQTNIADPRLTISTDASVTDKKRIPRQEPVLLSSRYGQVMRYPAHKAATTGRFIANFGGPAGNSIVLTFNGVQNVQTVVNAWNAANPTNSVRFVAVNPTEVLPAQTVSLSDGAVGPGETLDGHASVIYPGYRGGVETVTENVIYMDSEVVGTQGTITYGGCNLPVTVNAVVHNYGDIMNSATITLGKFYAARMEMYDRIALATGA